MNKKKILEVVYGFGYGGIQTFLLNTLRNIDRSKFHIDIYVFGYDSSPFTDLVHDLGSGIYFQPENNAKKNIPRFIKQIRKFIKEHGPYDVVHAHSNLISAWVLLAAKLEGVPVLLPHSHSSNHFNGSILQKKYSLMRRIIINRLATKKLACGQLAGISMYGENASFDVVSNGIDIDKFIKYNREGVAVLRKSLSIDENVRVYANVTRLDSTKNHLFALEVFNEIHKSDPTAVFVYGGEIPIIDSTYEEVKKKIIALGIGEFCRFCPPIPNVSDLYHMTDVWIYCSNHEGLPFGAIELQAAGTHILASDRITKEIDLGLGLVHFHSLDENPEIWSRTATGLQKSILSSDKIISTFRKHNFDIKQTINHLNDIYDQ